MMECPLCEGTGEVAGQYVLCEGFYTDVVAKSPNLADLIDRWTGARSLRFETIDGQIVDVSEDDYRKANEMARSRKRHRAATR